MFKFFVVLLVFARSTSCEEFKLCTVELGPAQATDGSTRIIGGYVTTIEKYPYIVQVMRSNKLVSGGSLLTRRHVLSAAHCFYKDNKLLTASAIRIRVGTTIANSGPTLHTVSTLVIHERYNVPLRENDIAVVVLADSVTLSARVQLALVPVQGGVVPDNAPVWHVGSPPVGMSGYSKDLHEVQVRAINESVCRSHYTQIFGQELPVTSNMICAGLLDEGGKDACRDDDGGQVVYNGVVVGVNSWGSSCDYRYLPGVSVKVAAYTNWLELTVARYSAGPTHLPSACPTHLPTAGPTHLPTAGPTHLPTAGPTHLPTAGPTHLPSAGPTHLPSFVVLLASLAALILNTVT